MLELDKMKNIYRQTYVLHEDRKENDAEHSWHLAILAFLLAEYASVPIDVTRVMKMVLVHVTMRLEIKPRQNVKKNLLREFSDCYLTTRKKNSIPYGVNSRIIRQTIQNLLLFSIKCSLLS